MKFHPEKYRIIDEPEKPFIDVHEIEEMLAQGISDRTAVREIIAKSLSKNRLSLQETAVLLNTTDPELIEEIKDGARKLKEDIYGNRIVLFAPLYVGNRCTNNCLYCGFRTSNRQAHRSTLNNQQLTSEVVALENQGQKRLILVFGEHPEYSPEFIADCVRTVYGVKSGKGEIRRVNINAAPMDIEGFRTVKKAGIGTYQIFQETYHPEAYKRFHVSGQKRDYGNRLCALDRAQLAGIDDVGIGALLGLYDWRFEVMSLVRHTNHLEACFNVGPHTLSFPRLQDASAVSLVDGHRVSDQEFSRLITILRLAVPYSGMILTAREPAALRDELMQYGVSQIDGGTRIEIGAYGREGSFDQNLDKEQFLINDNRNLNEVIDELIGKDQIPSFCTACYRRGRTGEHFMEISVPGFIKDFCTPNAMLTLAEYLEDYASVETSAKGWNLIERELAHHNGGFRTIEIRERLERIKTGERDIYF